MSNQDKEISIKEITNYISEFFRFYKSKKYIAIIILLGGIGLGIAASFIYHTKYTASLSFATEESESGGSISSLASQFGISLGAGSGGAFGGDNLYELFSSRYIIEKTLLTTIPVNNKENNLISLFIQTYGLDKKFKSSQYPALQKVSFSPNNIHGLLSRTQDSIVGELYKVITSKMLTVQKRSKKLSIGDITFTSRNELLSKLFVEQLIKHTSEFYIETKTKVSRTNYELLKYQTDSIKREFDQAVAQRAYLADDAMHSVKQSSNIGLMKKQTEVQVSMNAYIEMKKNLEMLKYSIVKETPVIQIIDKPHFPLEKKELTPLVGIVLGSLLGLFSGLFLMILLYFKR